ncbi:hypothetical protein ACLHLP_00600 [Weissella confusa]|uniref:hypothetical protein n=1 Tax=Weissella confusa TaxID=1583 RepID=UPI00223C14C3|nr:hypothetical protein [Weissella confusa]MCT0023430.1 hypothetical protein [Weissella confusa]
MSYQLRISYETAILIEELKRIYEDIEKSPVTKGEVLIRSYYDSKWVKDWQKVYEQKIKVKNTYEIKENALRPRLQLTTEVEQGIKDLKIEIAKTLGLRSVTLGVVVRQILKASFIKNTNESTSVAQEKIITQIFDKYKGEITSLEEKETVLQILNDLENEILSNVTF